MKVNKWIGFWNCSDSGVYVALMPDFRIVLTLWYFLFLFILFPENDNENRVKSLISMYSIHCYSSHLINRYCRQAVVYEPYQNDMLFKSFDTSQNMFWIRYLRFYYYYLVHTSDSRHLIPRGYQPSSSQRFTTVMVYKILVVDLYIANQSIKGSLIFLI